MDTFKYHDSVVWQKAINLAKETIILSRKLPKSEEFGLKIQMLESAISVSKNIAEGSLQKTKTDQENFFVNARIALFELDTQVEVGVHMKYFSLRDQKKLEPPFIEIYKLISALINPD